MIVGVAATDIHQHLWPPSFLSALSARTESPRLRGRALEVAGEPVWELNVESHELETRLALLDRCELDRAVVSLQPTLGIDRLPDDEAGELLATWEDGILELARAAGDRIVPLAARDPADEFAGLCVAGAELLDLDALAPRLDALMGTGGFLFVHPGAASTPLGAPSWWTAMVDYTAEMQAAYMAWLANGAARWPDLDVVFAILAGGAPIQLERMVARGADERGAMLTHVWFDIATYGRRALDLAMSTFGVEPMLFGSDMPVVDPDGTLDAVRSFGEAVAEAVLSTNPERLLRQ
jgi:6-methylsalicylate decarboxylase